MKIIILILLNLTFSWLLLKLAYNFLLKNKIYDHPNQRSLHTSPKVRGGGIAILLCYELFILLFFLFDYIDKYLLISQIMGGIILGFVGWIDDRNHVPIGIRFLCHLLSAILLLFLFNWFPVVNIFGKDYYLYGFGVVIFILFAVWMINLYNFMDGIDGIAISELIVPSVFIAGIFGIYQHYEISLLSLVIIASSIFFYIYNWPPSKMFMGDVFSGFIGYYFASLTLYINNILQLSIFIIPVLLSVFIYDATITLSKRLLKKEKIWEAHNDHIYQEFAKKYGHRKVTIVIIIIDFSLFLPAFLIFRFPEFDLFIAILTYFFLSVSIFLFKRKYLKDIKINNRYEY
jgi:Fuc2NAc and GlcNAc transferase